MAPPRAPPAWPAAQLIVVPIPVGEERSVRECTLPGSLPGSLQRAVYQDWEEVHATVVTLYGYVKPWKEATPGAVQCCGMEGAQHVALLHVMERDWEATVENMRTALGRMRRRFHNLVEMRVYGGFVFTPLLCAWARADPGELVVVFADTPGLTRALREWGVRQSLSPTVFENPKLVLYRIPTKDGWGDFFAADATRRALEAPLATIQREVAAGTSVFPDTANLFRAFRLCPLEHTRVILLGQDPYYTAGMADGLCFSTTCARLPPSLHIIFKELQASGVHVDPTVGDLSWWAGCGVLMLNTALSVRERAPESHLEVWKPFMGLFFAFLRDRVPRGVGLLWGAKAKAYQPKFPPGWTCLTAGHPVTEAREFGRGSFYGCRFPLKTNAALEGMGLPPIEWDLTEEVEEEEGAGDAKGAADVVMGEE